MMSFTWIHACVLLENDFSCNLMSFTLIFHCVFYGIVHEFDMIYIGSTWEYAWIDKLLPWKFSTFPMSKIWVSNAKLYVITWVSHWKLHGFHMWSQRFSLCFTWNCTGFHMLLLLKCSKTMTLPSAKYKFHMLDIFHIF